MQRWLILIAAGAALSGCKALDKDRPPREERSPADPASRTRPTGKGWLDGPSPGLDRVDTPPADSWADPRSPGYDVDREVRGVLAGFVEDPEGRKLRDVFIEVEPVDGAGGGAPVGVQTGRDGYFLIKGLQPKRTYQLTARVKTADGPEMAGRVYAQTSTERSQFIRLTLLEGLTFPGGPAGRDRPSPATPTSPTPPASTPATPTTPDKPSPGPAAIPPPVLPSGGTPPSDGAWSPNGPPTGPSTPRRPDLVTEGPSGIWKPPATSIPSHTPTPPPAPPASPPASGSSRSKSRSVRPGAGFSLVDPVGRTREFPSDRGEELVLLDFMTTTCVPCKKAIPVLKELQARYGLSGCEVVGVVCDDADLPQRRALASAYQRNERLNYLLYVEPQAGSLRRRFDVQAYPTLVLLDSSGEVLWKGHPRDLAELDRVIADELARRRQ